MNTAPAEIAASVAAPVRHQRLRVAAGQVEEHEIGRRVVEERGQQAGRPEVHRVDRLAGRRRHQCTMPRERAVLARRAASRSTGAMVMKIAGEQLRDFLDRRPVEVVAGARDLRRERERQRARCTTSSTSRTSVLQLRRACRTRRTRRPASRSRSSAPAATIRREQHEIDLARRCRSGASGVASVAAAAPRRPVIVATCRAR